MSDDDFEQGRMYPSLKRICEVSVAIALAVAKVVFARKLTGMTEPSDLLSHIESKMYDPVYPRFPAKITRFQSVQAMRIMKIGKR